MLLTKVSKCWKIIEFPKTSIKMKKCKLFYEPQTAKCLQEIIHPAAPDKSSLLLWNKKFPTEIKRNMQTFTFQLLWECSSWASRNGAEQMFFLTPTRNIFARKFCKVSKVFGCVAGVYFFIKLSELRFVNWVIFFASFSWLWDFSPENLKLKDKLQIEGFELFIFCFKIRFLGLF